MRTSPFLAALLAALPLPGQQITGEARDWLLPVRADGDAAGTFWASGPTYKVRFDDGMTFFPVLGAAAPQNLPLAWRTESIGFDGQQGVAPAACAVTRSSEWRYELSRPGVTETYDVLAAGIEQSFVVADPGQASIRGDLVIRGRLDTPLHCAPRAAAHAALRFAADDGRAVIEYGAAFALDARGHRLPITTALSAGSIELRVPAAWLQDACWPVTVDPLTQRLEIVGSVLGGASSPIVTQDVDQGRFVVTDSRPVSANDYDLALRLRRSDWTSVATLYSDVTTANTRNAAVTVGSFTPRRWLLAFQRETATTSRVRLYFHDSDDVGYQTGLLSEIPLPPGVHDAEPSLGATSSTWAFLAMRRDVANAPANTEASYPVGCRIDLKNRTFEAPRLLHTNPGNNYDVEHVSVSSIGDSEWMVVWQEYNFDNVGDDWDIIAQSVEPSGIPAEYLVLGEASNNGLHKLTPVVDGNGFEFLVAYLTRANTGTKTTSLQGTVLRVQRFSWQGNSGWVPSPSQIIDFAAENDLLLGLTNRPLAFCPGTNSHWAVAWKRAQTQELRVARIGFDSGVAEQAQLEPAPAAGSFYSPSMCWDWGSAGFAIVYASSNVTANDPLFSRRFVFDSRTQATSYGSGCAGIVTGAASAFDQRPHAGTGRYHIGLGGARPSAPTVLFAAFAPTDIPMPFGSSGCRLLLDPALPIVSVLQGVAKTNGSFETTLGIPSGTHATSVYWQYVQLDQGAVWSSNALHTRIY